MKNFWAHAIVATLITAALMAVMILLPHVPDLLKHVLLTLFLLDFQRRALDWLRARHKRIAFERSISFSEIKHMSHGLISRDVQ